MFRNTIWNLLGEGLPMLAALLSIPLLVGAVGIERFGALTLVWALLGTLMVLDLGLSRALIQTVAERRGLAGGGEDGRVVRIVRPALALMAGAGLAMGAAVAVFAGPLADAIVQGSDAVTAEVEGALLVVAAILPVALLSAGLRGVLEAHREFRRVNLVKMAVGVANYLSPLCVLPFSDGLVPVVAAIAAGRLAGMLAYGWLCLRVMPGLFRPAAGPRETLRPLFAMGAWAMLNNLLGPLMSYADRFVLAALVPVGVVAFYTTPFEIVSRLLFIPAALSGVLFPTAAGLFRRRPQALARILDTGGFAIAGMFLAVLGGAALLGGPALHLWLGPDFAAGSAAVLAVLALGLLFNAVAYVPYALIHAAGRMDVTARLQLAELPVYLAVLWLLVGAYGPLGAAAAWALRTGADLALLLALLPRVVPGTGPAARRLGAVVGLAGGAGALGLLLGDGPGTVVLLAGLAAGAAVAVRRLAGAWAMPAALDHVPDLHPRTGTGLP